MTWYRNIFVDTLSVNEGSLTVVDLGLTNEITFEESPNAVKYTLLARKFGDTDWQILEEQDVLEGIALGSFIDDFEWLDEPDSVAIEYKVEVTKTSPETPEGYYTTGLDGRSEPIDPDPANRVPGIYEKVFYQAGDKEINEELSTRSDWDININAGKYEATFRSGFNTTTTIGGVVVDWSGSHSQINNLSDEDFTQHLLQLRDRWIDWIADSIRDKITNRGLVMSELDAYLSDPEIHLADNAFSGGLANAGFYQHGANIGYTPSNNEIASNPYFRFDESTGLASATSKANIFVDVWLLGMYFILIGPGYEDLELEGIFSHYNLPYRIPTGKLNAFNSVPVLNAMDRTQRTQFLLNVYKTMHGDGIDVIEGFDHEGIQSAYDLCGTFVDFYPATFADQMDSFMAFIDALEAFGTPGKNTLMASGQFNNSPDIFQVLCEDWKGHPDLVNKPYYDERDWNQTFAPPSQGVYGTFPLSVWLYIQDYIVNNTSINLQRFYTWGIDNTMFRWNGSETDINRINEFVQVVGGQWGTPYMRPPTETNKRDYAEYRAYGQFSPDKDYTTIRRGRPTTREFVPDHRPFYAMSLSVESQDDPDITVNGLSRECDPDGDISIVGASEYDHWKMNKAPYDGRDGNFLAPFCPAKPWLEHGYGINRKSNPNTTNPEDDFILRLVHDDPNNPGPLEDAYRRGYRRFMLRGVFGMRTRSTNGSAVPSAIWSAGDPNLGTWNDKPSIGMEPSEDFEYPFTSNGNLMSMDPSATKGDAQQSVINFLKPWIQSKEDLGDPVDVYIYGGYQPAFYGNGDPARGNLSMTFYVGDSAWKLNQTNSESGVSWRDHFPLPDMSNPDHIEYFDAEYLPWIDVGVKGFIIDGASNGGELPDGSGVPVSGADPPIDRIPGVFPYFREHLGVDVLGEAVPLAQFGENAAMNEDLYKETGFMAYSHDTYWDNMWRNINISPEDSEIHIFLLWAFNGGWQKRNGVWVHADPNGGINSAYATIDPTIDNVVYDIAGMKAEIDEMRARGFVVSANIGLYSGTSPPNEAAARREIIDYVSLGREATGLRSRIGGGTNEEAFVPAEILNGDPHSMYFFSGFACEAECAIQGNCTNDDIIAYDNVTDQQIRDRYRNTTLNSIDPHNNIVRNTYLNEITTGYINLDIEAPLNLGFIEDPGGPTLEQLDIFVKGLIRRIQILREFVPNAKISVWKFAGPQRAALPDQYELLKPLMLLVSEIEYNGQTLFDAVDFLAPVIYQKHDTTSSVHTRTARGDRTDQLIDMCDAIFERHGETKPVIPIMAFEYEGGPLINASAHELNAIEINNLRDYAQNFIMWHAGAFDFTPISKFEGKLDTLMNEIDSLEDEPEGG